MFRRYMYEPFGYSPFSPFGYSPFSPYGMRRDFDRECGPGFGSFCRRRQGGAFGYPGYEPYNSPFFPFTYY